MTLENAQDLASSNAFDLSNAVRITKNNTNLRWCQPFLCKLANVILNILGGDLEPSRRSSLVRKSRRRNTLTSTVHTTHGDVDGEGEGVAVVAVAMATMAMRMMRVLGAGMMGRSGEDMGAEGISERRSRWFYFHSEKPRNSWFILGEKGPDRVLLLQVFQVRGRVLWVVSFVSSSHRLWNHLLILRQATPTTQHLLMSI